MSGDGYTVELGGQTFTQAQWEAVQTYVKGTSAETLSDAATWTADVTREPTGGQELRTAVARAVWDKMSAGYLGDVDLRPTAVADAVLALPELAALIADADNWRRATTGDPTEPLPLAMQARDLLLRNRELEATVARVRGLVEWNKRMAGRYQANGTVIANDLTQALDGEPQP